MKRINKKVVFLSLFMFYIIQGIYLLTSNAKLNSIDINKIEDITSKTYYHNDIGDVIQEITSLGFNIESIGKVENEIKVEVFSKVLDDNIINSLESLKNLNYSIEEYNITKDNTVCAKFSVKAL